MIRIFILLFYLGLIAPGAAQSSGQTRIIALPSASPNAIVPAFVRYALTGINFNSATTDNPIAITLPPGMARWRIQYVHITNASASISTATLGVFTGAGGTGQTIAADQAITVTQSAANTNANMQNLALTNGATEAYSVTQIFIRVGTPQGSAATADVTITIVPLT